MTCLVLTNDHDMTFTVLFLPTIMTGLLHLFLPTVMTRLLHSLVLTKDHDGTFT